MHETETRTEDQDVAARPAAQATEAPDQARRRALRAAAAAEASYLLSVRAH
jgi:hypothetical protein